MHQWLNLRSYWMWLFCSSKLILLLHILGIMNCECHWNWYILKWWFLNGDAAQIERKCNWPRKIFDPNSINIINQHQLGWMNRNQNWEWIEGRMPILVHPPLLNILQEGREDAKKFTIKTSLYHIWTRILYDYQYSTKSDSRYSFVHKYSIFNLPLALTWHE